MLSSVLRVLCYWKAVNVDPVWPWSCTCPLELHISSFHPPPPEVDFVISFSFLHWKSNSNNDSNVTLKNKQKNRQQQKKTTKTRKQSQRHCSDGAEQPKFTSFIHPFGYWNDLIFISSWCKTKLQFAKPERLTNCYILFLHFQFTFQVK